MQKNLKSVSRINTVVIDYHDQRLTAAGRELLLNDRDEFCRRSPILVTTQNPDSRNFLQVIGNDVFRFLTRAKSRNGDHYFVWRAGLIQQAPDSGFQIGDAIRQSG